MRFRRRPIATAAVIGGVAHAGARAGAESAAAEAQQQEAPPPAPPEPAAGGMGPEQMEQLKQLAALHEQGVLTDEEFAEQKANILG